MAGGLASTSSVGSGLIQGWSLTAVTRVSFLLLGTIRKHVLLQHCGWELPIATDGFRGGGWMGRIFIITDGQSSLWTVKFSMEGLTCPQLFFKLMAGCG